MTTSPNKALQEPALGDYVASWNLPLNNNFGSIDSATASKTTISGLTTSNYALSQTELIPNQIVLQGNLANNIVVTIPGSIDPTGFKIAGNWIFNNQTTGLYSIILQNSDPNFPTAPLGLYLVLAQGYSSRITSDGTNVYLSDSRKHGVPTGGGTDQIFFLNQQATTTAYTLPVGQNAFSGGPITQTVPPTIPPGSTWTIV
jgi:hypothetical protein